MNPYVNIEIGSNVIVTKRVLHSKSNVPLDMIGKMFAVQELEYDGRQHNKYVSCIYIRDKKGNQYKAIVDQLASVNPNYEPEGDIIVCTACGATMYDEDLKTVRGLDERACPNCGTINCTES